MPRKTVRSRDRRTAGSRFNEAAARCRGKLHGSRADAETALAASMRPRPDAAENLDHRRAGTRQLGASMRPRPDAAENIRQGRKAAKKPRWLQ